MWPTITAPSKSISRIVLWFALASACPCPPWPWSGEDRRPVALAGEQCFCAPSGAPGTTPCTRSVLVTRPHCAIRRADGGGYPADAPVLCGACDDAPVLCGACDDAPAECTRLRRWRGGGPLRAPQGADSACRFLCHEALTRTRAIRTSLCISHTECGFDGAQGLGLLRGRAGCRGSETGLRGRAGPWRPCRCRFQVKCRAQGRR